MQFDKTRIVVRERNFLDILDLALMVIREHARPLAVSLAAGIVPAALLNTWLLNGLVESLLEIDATFNVGELVASLVAFFMLLAMLVILEIPLATAFATLYLGKALFEQTPSARQIVVDFLRSLPQLFLFQVLLRSLFIPFVLTWFVPFAVWPYLNEVILLERNPLRRRGAGSLNTLVRSYNLHSAGGGDLFGRWLAAATFGICWMLALWGGLFYLRAQLSGFWEADAVLLLGYLQLAIWLVVGYFTVVRFLSYLDTAHPNRGLGGRAAAAGRSRDPGPIMDASEHDVISHARPDQVDSACDPADFGSCFRLAGTRRSLGSTSSRISRANERPPRRRNHPSDAPLVRRQDRRRPPVGFADRTAPTELELELLLAGGCIQSPRLAGCCAVRAAAGLHPVAHSSVTGGIATAAKTPTPLSRWMIEAAMSIASRRSPSASLGRQPICSARPVDNMKKETTPKPSSICSATSWWSWTDST